MILNIKDLHASANGAEIIKGISLEVRENEFHVLMGPNGTGKTTLAEVIMGSPKFKVTGGDILVDGKSILGLSPEARAKLGLFLQFQNPVEIEGVGFVNFMYAAKKALQNGQIDVGGFMKEITAISQELQIDKGIVGRSLNQGFSGGEKKKSEILQLAALKPKIAILDEPDSGLDVDAIGTIAKVINRISAENKMGLLVITHYSRILLHMKPQFVHIMINGKIVKEGGSELIKFVDEKGYDPFLKNGSM